MMLRTWHIPYTCLAISLFFSAWFLYQDYLGPSRLFPLSPSQYPTAPNLIANDEDNQPIQQPSPPDPNDTPPTFESLPNDLYRLPSRNRTDLRTTPFPAKIWQSWQDDAADPTPRTAGFPHAWRALNPEHRYERVTDGNSAAYVRQRLPSPIADLFDALDDPILRADLLRYLIMFADGGVWADIDTLPVVPVARWVGAEEEEEEEEEEGGGSVNVVVGIENDHEGEPIFDGVPYSVQFAQYAMRAKPGHAFFAELVRRVCGNLREIVDRETMGDEGREDASREMRENMRRRRRNRRFEPGHVKFDDVMRNTGPLVFTEVLFEYLESVTGVAETGSSFTDLREPKLVGDVLILPRNAFGWLAHEHEMDHDESQVLLKHIFQASWRESHPE